MLPDCKIEGTFPKVFRNYISSDKKNKDAYKISVKKSEIFGVWKQAIIMEFILFFN